MSRVAGFGILTVLRAWDELLIKGSRDDRR